MNDETLYKVQHDELIETYTRLSNARNWGIIIAFGVAAGAYKPFVENHLS